MKEITAQEVIESGILFEAKNLIPLGGDSELGWWFKDQDSGIAYRIIRFKRFLEVKEIRKCRDRRPISTKRRVIICEDCGAKRKVVSKCSYKAKYCEACQHERLKIRDRKVKREKYARKKEKMRNE